MSALEFWKWFSANADRIATDPNSPDVIDELDRRVQDAWPELAWEIGPDASGGWYLALSPNLDRTLASKARDAVDAAPKVLGWRFLAARPPKVWNGEFELETANGTLRMTSDGWKFVLLQYASGEQELVLVGEDASQLNEDERWHAAAITLEGMLGEQRVLDNIASFALVPSIEAQHMAKARSITLLPKVYNLH